MNFDFEKNGAEFISRNENSKKVLGNPSNKKNYTCNVTFYCMVHRAATPKFWTVHRPCNY